MPGTVRLVTSGGTGSLTYNGQPAMPGGTYIGTAGSDASIDLPTISQYLSGTGSTLISAGEIIFNVPGAYSTSNY